ncbi:hypothetical protein [Empedobacter falsenii]
MRKILLLILGISLNTTNGQITTLNVPKDKIVEEQITYDVTTNFMGSNAKAYIGQELYLKGISETLQGYGYSDFKTDQNTTYFRESNVYKCCSSKSPYNSSYELLNGKYFKVLEVIPYGYTKEFPTLYSEYFFKLEEKESKDIVYYKYNGKYEHSFPFVVVSHFEHLKENAKGIKIIVTKNYFDNTDLNGDTFELKTGDVWTVEDVTIEDKYYKLVYVVKNSRGNRKTLNVDSFNDTDPNRAIHTVKDYNKYKLKFGATNWNKIFEEGKVVVGFTEEMCLLAWGNPNSINEASYGDQWVYDNQYLYFKNGKLTSFN